LISDNISNVVKDPRLNTFEKYMASLKNPTLCYTTNLLAFESGGKKTQPAGILSAQSC